MLNFFNFLQEVIECKCLIIIISQEGENYMCTCRSNLLKIAPSLSVWAVLQEKPLNNTLSYHDIHDTVYIYILHIYVTGSAKTSLMDQDFKIDFCLT